MMKKLFLLSALSLTYVGFAQQIESTSAPVSGDQGEMITITLDYTSPTAGTYQFELWPTTDVTAANPQPDWAAGAIANTFRGGDVAVAATTTTITEMIMIPADLPVTSSLTAPAGYVWFIKIAVDGTDYFPAAYPTTEVTDSTLGINDFAPAVDSSEMFFRNSSNSLVINPDKITSEKALIFDITGKNIVTINNLKEIESMDLSSLDNGIYILRTDDNKSIKFVR